MAKYEFDLSVGIQEVLDADSAKKVESQIEKQKQKFEEPIELKLSVSDAKKRLQELEKEARKTQRALTKATSAQNFNDIAKHTRVLANIQKEQEELSLIIGKQVDSIVQQVDATKAAEAAEKRRKKTVDKTRVAAQDMIDVLIEQAELLERVAEAEEKINKSQKTRKGTSTRKGIESKQSVNVTPDVIAIETQIDVTDQLTDSLNKQANAIDNIVKKMPKMETVIKRYNALMNAAGAEHMTIGTDFSTEDTKGWGISEMVKEAQYWLSTFYESGHVNEMLRDGDTDEKKEWRSIVGKFQRFIDAYKSYSEVMTAVDEKEQQKRQGLEKEANLISRLHDKYTALRQLYDNNPTLNEDKADDRVQKIGEIIAYYEKEKAIIEEVFAIRKELAEIPAEFKKGTAIDTYETYGFRLFDDDVADLTELIKDYHNQLLIEQEAAKNIVQLVDNYGQSLDKINNKLMQGVKLLNQQGQVLRLFHNSPNVFDTFDSRKSGTHQGQALGFGHYLALQQNGEFNNLDYGRYQTQWYANVQNPFKVGDKITSEQANIIVDEFLTDVAKGLKQHMLSKLIENDVVDAVKDIAAMSKTVVGEIFSRIGYDAIMDGAQINVFDRSKIYRANDSVLDIGVQEFAVLDELQQKVWGERTIIENVNRQIEKLSNQYSGKTAEELDFDLFMETLSKGWGWQQNVAKIASAFKELTGGLPQTDEITEDSLRALVEDYEFSRQGLKEFQDAAAEHGTILSQLESQLSAQKAITDTIIQSYLAGNISGIVVLNTNENNKMITGNAGETYAGKNAIKFKYAVMSVEDLVISHDVYGKVNENYPAELQPRDRSRMMSTAQVLGMVKNIMPELLAASPTAQNGSPIVSKDGIVIGGNARSAALTEAYRTGHADGYMSYMKEHASEFGLNPNNMPNNPVLVRVVDIDSGLDVLAKQLNEATTAGYSVAEQALINEELVMRVISKLNLDESANLNSEANKDFVNSFINLLSDNQKNEMVTRDGSLSAVGLAKVKQAITGAAYGSREMLENLEQISPELLNISNALMAGAAKAADIRYNIENGTLNDLGVVSTILNGLDLLKEARGKNHTIEEYLDQGSLFGLDYAAEDIAIGKFLEDNVRSAANLRNMIDTILDFARSAGDPNQISFDGIEEITLSDVVRNAFAKYVEKYQKSIDYDELIKGYLPAESGSRSDKRVDRNNSLEAESALTPVIEENTQRRQEQADTAERTTNAIREQVDAEERLTEAARKTKDVLTDVNSTAISMEEIVARDINKALEQLRSAKNNETTLFSLKGVFEGEDLVTQAQNMIENIASKANLSLGKFEAFDNDGLIKVQLYNDELKVAVDQTYKLVAATEEMESAQLQLIKTHYSQNVKALNANPFDSDSAQKSALSSLEKLRADAERAKYDLSELEQQAKAISSTNDVTKFNNELKVAQNEIQAIKNSTATKSSMNPLINMQRDMKVANTELDTMRLKLEKLGDVSGIEEANRIIAEMTTALNEYNQATTSEGQQKAYNQYSDLRHSFKAQMEYINAAKALNDQQTSTQKQTDPIRDQYQSILDLVNKINDVSSNITKYQAKDGGTGIFAGYIGQLQSEKAKLVSELQGITDTINNTLSGGFIQGKEYSVPFASILDGSGAISGFLNDTRTQASLTTDEIEKLVVALQKSQNIDVEATSRVMEQFKSVQETYKKLSELTTLDKGNSNYQALVGLFGQIVQYKQQLSSDPTSWAPEESAHLQQLINQFTQYGNALAQAGEKEARYFAGKQKYTHEVTTSNMSQGITEETKRLNDIQQQLEQAARTFAKESGASDAFVTGFAQGADGIAKLDFSVFDAATGSLRNFRMEMGSVTEGMFVTETTVSKSLAGIQAAQKQLQSTGNLLGKLDASGVNVGEGTAPAQVQKVLALYQQLSAEIAKGDGADQNKITKLTNDLKLASSETEKLYKNMIKMDGVLQNGQAINLGMGDVKGDVYSQLTNAAQQLIGTQQGVTLEFGNFDAATNTLNASMTHVNGTVESVKLQMNQLSGQMTAQRTGVGKLTNSWDTFKAGLAKAGKQLMMAVVGYNVFFKAISAVRKGIGYVKEIDLAMTELKKVTDESAASYKEFLNTAADTAGRIGSTVADFTEATANFARLGYTMEEAAKMAETAVIYKNVADGISSVEEATDSIISTMKAFGIESSNTMQIIDIFNEVGECIAQVA